MSTTKVLDYAMNGKLKELQEHLSKNPNDVNVQDVVMIIDH